MRFIRNPKGGDALDAMRTMYPSRLEVVSGIFEGEDETSTSYGYVVSGSAEVATAGLRVRADEGTFFSIPGRCLVEARGRVVLMRRLGYRGLTIVGRIEEAGRLSYIDGCSSTILVAPPRIGDPVLNHLHIPPGTDQSQHVHPSLRMGVVARGRGIAYCRNGDGEIEWEEPLEAGTVFLLNAQERHSFSTKAGRDGLDMITYHPDSDTGPTDGDNPMVGRTYLRAK